MNEAVYIVKIEFDPVTKQIQMQSTVNDDLVVFGMLELAKSALVQRQVAANSGNGPRLVVPAPQGVS